MLRALIPPIFRNTEDEWDQRPKHVELIGIINKPLLLHLVGVYIIYILIQYICLKTAFNDAVPVSKSLRFFLFLYFVWCKNIAAFCQGMTAGANCPLLMKIQNTSIIHACVLSRWFAEVIMFGFSKLIVLSSPPWVPDTSHRTLYTFLLFRRPDDASAQCRSCAASR